jgi:hypothetical protein
MIGDTKLHELVKISFSSWLHKTAIGILSKNMLKTETTVTNLGCRFVKNSLIFNGFLIAYKQFIDKINVIICDVESKLCTK